LWKIWLNNNTDGNDDDDNDDDSNAAGAAEFLGRSWKMITWMRRQKQLRRKRWRDGKDCRRFRRSYGSRLRN